MKKLVIAASCVAAVLVSASPAAARLPLLQCHPSAKDRHYAVAVVIVNREEGCSAGDGFAAAWQRAEWAGRLGTHTPIVTFTWNGQFNGKYLMRYRTYRGDDPILRVEAFGTNGKFVSFMTDQ